MKITLLVFSDFPDGSAMGRRTHLLSKGFAELGHEVSVVVAQRFSNGPLYEEFDGLKVYWGTLTTPETFHDLSERLKARWASYKIVCKLFRQGMDWLILIFPELDRLPYLLVAKKYGVKIISSYEDDRTLPPNPTIRNYFLFLRAKLADKIIPRLTNLNTVTSTFLDRAIRKTAPKTPTFLFPPIVDPEVFVYNQSAAGSFRSKWKLGNDVVVAYTGTYWYVEGLANLLAAANNLSQSGEKFKLVISGKAHLGLFADNVSELIGKYHLENVVIETGWLATEEVVAAMSAADILVAPKLSHPANVAGMPTKLAEYLATGHALITTRVGDIPLYLTDSEDSLLCEPGNDNSLTEKLRILIRDKSNRIKLAANARNTACKHFDYRSVTKRLESMMIQLQKSNINTL